MISLRWYILGFSVCLLGWLVGFAFFLSQASTNEHKGLFPSSHTWKNTMKVHWGKKRKIKSVQIVMVYSSSHELVELKQAWIVVLSKLQQRVTSLWIQSLLGMDARHHNLMWITKSKQLCYGKTNPITDCQNNCKECVCNSLFLQLTSVA